jgi:membrane-bound lytic murein transglycosylase D
LTRWRHAIVGVLALSTTSCALIPLPLWPQRQDPPHVRAQIDLEIELIPPAPISIQPTLWEALARDRALPECKPEPVQKWMRLIGGSERRLVADLDRVQPYLAYVKARADALGLPAEAALLPFVESGYRQVRGRGPRGWWQLVDGTGRQYGLTIDRRQDERLDPVRATGAALKMLAELQRRYDGNFRLALIAYNRGPLNLDRVLARKRIDPDEVRSMEGLESPKVTLEHIARLKAWGCLIAEGVAGKRPLPEPVAFRAHRLDAPLPIGAIDALLGERAEEWRRQHPKLAAQGRIEPGQPFLGPADLRTQIVALGDLSRFPSVASREPPSGDDDPPSRKTPGKAPRVHVVRSGDNLWTLARRYDTRVVYILKLNPKLHRKSVLRLGQKVLIPAA